jgi:hypothetical protein
MLNEEPSDNALQVESRGDHDKALQKPLDAGADVKQEHPGLVDSRHRASELDRPTSGCVTPHYRPNGVSSR